MTPMKPRYCVLMGLVIVGFAVAAWVAESPQMQLYWMFGAIIATMLTLADFALVLRHEYRRRRGIAVVKAVVSKEPRGINMSAVQAELEKSPPIPPANVEHPDPLAREVIARAFNEGGIVYGQRDADGNERIERKP